MEIVGLTYSAVEAYNVLKLLKRENKMQTPLNELMQKEVNRREFLVMLGFGVASVVGLSTFLRMLGHKSPLQRYGAGYGSSAYGGGKD